jgi:hypothetical protein
MKAVSGVPVLRLATGTCNLIIQLVPANCAAPTAGVSHVALVKRLQKVRKNCFQTPSVGLLFTHCYCNHKPGNMLCTEMKMNT